MHMAEANGAAVEAGVGIRVEVSSVLAAKEECRVG